MRPQISVCVPAYERPAMLVELITSFAAQRGVEAELVITDDSRSEAVQTAVTPWVMVRSDVIYSRNARNLGFAANLRRALELAHGEFVLIMGDDDVFARSDALKTYADAFECFPGAAVAYSNLLQVDHATRLTYSYQSFPATRFMAAGPQAIAGLWLSSILITGLAFHRSGLLATYPERSMLFPQVAAAGHLLIKHGGVGIGEFLCATRAHAGQLGFQHLTGAERRPGERHGVEEVLALFDDLEAVAPTLGDSRCLIEAELTKQYIRNMPNERLLAGRGALNGNFFHLMRNRRSARGQPLPWVVWAVSITLPPVVLRVAKNSVRYVVAYWRLMRVGKHPGDLVDVRHLPPPAP